MKRMSLFVSFIAIILALALAATGQTPAASDQSAPAASLKAGTKIKAELESAVDTRTAKPGDEVVAKVTKDVKQNGKAVVRKGDRLKGRITGVQAAAEGQAESGSRLSVVFDRLVQGEASSQLNTVLSAVLSTPAEERARRDRAMQEEPMMAAPATAPMPAAGSSGSASGGLVGGVASTAGSAVNTVGSAAGNVTGSAAGTLNSSVSGAGSTVDAATRTQVGNTTSAAVATPMKAIRIDSSAQAENQNSASSVLSSKQGQLRLDSGTQLEFRVAAESQPQAKAERQ